VLTGFANFSWRALAQAYRAGIRGQFDLAAVHPFSGHLRNVLKIVQLNRDVMARNGDGRRQIAISELTWPSAKGKTKNTFGWETTEKGQAIACARPSTPCWPSAHAGASSASPGRRG